MLLFQKEDWIMARTKKPKEGQFTVDQLITYLEAFDPNIIIQNAFFEPCSHYSSPEDVAFAPITKGITVQTIKDSVVSVIFQQYPGWSSGLYTMRLETLCWIAHDGEIGIPVTKQVLDKIFAKAKQKVVSK